jgi:hypothetical protein
LHACVCSTKALLLLLLLLLLFALQECAGLRSRLEAAQRHSRTLEAERNGAQERLAAAQAREQALQQVGMRIFWVVDSSQAETQLLLRSSWQRRRREQALQQVGRVDVCVGISGGGGLISG